MNISYTFKGCWTAIYMFRTQGKKPVWLKVLVAISLGKNLKAANRAKFLLSEVE